MFTLERKTNPLDLLVANAGNAFVQRSVDQNRMQRRNEEVMKGFAKLNENSSPLDVLQTIDGLNIDPKEKELLYKGFEYNERKKLAREKMTHEEKKAEQKEKDKAFEEQRKKQETKLEEEQEVKAIAEANGIPYEKVRGMKPQRAATYALSQNKPAPGGVTAQAVPPEIAQAIEDTIQQNKEANADQLALKLTRAGVPVIFSNPYVESRRRQDEEKGKEERSEKKLSREEKLAFHKDAEKYDEKIREVGNIAQKQISSIKEIRSNLKEIKPGQAYNVFKSLGKKFTPIANAFQTSSQGVVEASIPQLLEGWKEVFGVRLSDADLKIIEAKLPSVSKSKEANEAILDILEKNARYSIKKAEIAREIKKENEGFRPLNFSDEVDERFEQSRAGRTKVAKGTPITNETASKYMRIAQSQNPQGTVDDWEREGMRMASEDNYE